MRLSNYFFFGVFVLLGFASLIGALFFGATWHYWTAALCALIAILFFDDIKKTQKDNG